MSSHHHEHAPSSGPPRICSHCSADTVLRCIRCKRPYCTDCLDRTDAGNICFECLGLPAPEIRQRARAAGQVLRLLGIATVLGLLQVYVSIERPFSNWGMLFGIAAGFLTTTQLAGVERERGMRGAITMGAGSIAQGLLIAAVVIGALGTAGAIPGFSGFVSAATLPAAIIDLLIRALFFYMTAVATVVAVLWQKSRF